MTSLQSIQSVILPKDLILKAHTHLHNVGKLGYEGVALWAGQQENHVFHVSATIIPAQIPIKNSFGVCYYVKSDELHRINVWLYENHITLIAQIHSHPGEAYHSNTDDLFPIVNSLGCFSLVVPNFAKQPFSLQKCAVFRLFSSGWVRVPNNEVTRLITIRR